MPLDHLAKLNIEQWRAVEPGVGGEAGLLSAPLLVIPGTGSGKTNTLAHRVANLIFNGADPHRILLMTVSRRTATEMSRRVESICATVLVARAGIMTDALTWAGTFHAIGAKLLREYAGKIGLQPSFTIHDREDSADLLNLFRHVLGFLMTLISAAKSTEASSDTAWPSPSRIIRRRISVRQLRMDAEM